MSTQPRSALVPQTQELLFLPPLGKDGNVKPLTAEQQRILKKFEQRKYAKTGFLRSVGGNNTKITRAFHPPKLRSRSTCLKTLRNSMNREVDATAIEEGDLEHGILSCIERGIIPPQFDTTQIVAGKHDANPLSVSVARLNNHVDLFKRQEILTNDVGFGALLNVRYDLAAIEAMPPDARRASPPKTQLEPLATPVVPTHPPTATNTITTTNEQLEKARDNARTYGELLDLYSLHEFVIRKGVSLRNTPEFLSFQRSFSSRWGAILQVIGHLENFLASYGVPLAFVDGKKVALLASVDLGLPSKEELLNCIANRTEVEPLTVSVVQQFHQGTRGHHAAATLIQSVYRMHRQRLAFIHLKAATRAAILMQRQWVVFKAHMKTRKTIATVREGLIFRWRETMAQFIQNWPQISQKKRVVVHLPSLSYSSTQIPTIPYYQAFQAAHLPRLADLEDPLIEVVMISPFRVDNEALQYYLNVLKAAGVPSPEARLTILVPENAKRLPQTLSLTKLVIMSSKTMKCLSSIIKGKPAYIVPGVVGPEELTLAAKLNVPLMAPEPKVAQVLGSKSGGKAVFESADMMTAVGARSIKDERDLYAALARFIAEYREYPRWMVKIDSEFGGRGLAFFDVRRLRTLEEFAEDTPAAVLTEKILAELRDSAGKRVKIVNTSIYPDWEAYIRAFNVSGGCLEAVPAECIASPVANLFISPSGQVKIVSVQEQILSPQYTAVGVAYPQLSVPYDAIRDAAISIGNSAYRKKVIGYVTVDFVVHKRGDALRLWAVDFKPHLTRNAALHSFISLVTDAQTNVQTGQSLALASSPNPHPLHYSYSGLIYHPYIGALRHSVFFNLCRQKGLSFDITNRAGVLFHLVDVLLCGCLGIIVVGLSDSAAAMTMIDATEFLQQQLSSAGASIDDIDSNFSYIATAARNLSQRIAADRKGERSTKHATRQGSVKKDASPTQ